MADDYERIFDIENMTDGELRDLVCQELREYPDIDPDLVDVSVTAGVVQPERPGRYRAGSCRKSSM